mmetsp:Transcript_42087/g.103775  ORF Transcript_42087/g.103775 Transcript_42087/m.103775 type:complete len:236 (+) Transcript_42087:1496-2203(+)
MNPSYTRPRPLKGGGSGSGSAHGNVTIGCGCCCPPTGCCCCCCALSGCTIAPGGSASVLIGCCAAKAETDAAIQVCGTRRVALHSWRTVCVLARAVARALAREACSSSPVSATITSPRTMAARAPGPCDAAGCKCSSSPAQPTSPGSGAQSSRQSTDALLIARAMAAGSYQRAPSPSGCSGASTAAWPAPVLVSSLCCSSLASEWSIEMMRQCVAIAVLPAPSAPSSSSVLPSRR